VDTLEQYFSYSWNILDTYNFLVLLGDFDVPDFYWKIGLSSISSYYYSKLKGENIYSSTGLLVLSQHNYFPNNGNLLDLMFSSFTDFSMTYGAPLYLPPSFCHRITIAYPKVQLYRLISLSESILLGITSCFTTLYTWLLVCVQWNLCPCCCWQTVAVISAIEIAVPTGCRKRCNFYVWFSDYAKFCTKRTYCLYRPFKKYRCHYFHDKFSSYRGLFRAVLKIWQASVA